MSSESYSTEQRANEILHYIEESVVTLEQHYGLQSAVTEVRMPIAEYVTRNDTSFLRITWNPQDGLSYRIGPLKNGRIPRRSIFYTPGSSLNDYDLCWFAEINGKSVDAPIRGKSAPLDVAFRNALSLIDECAGEFLRGDWSRRSELDAAVDTAYRLH